MKEIKEKGLNRIFTADSDDISCDEALIIMAQLSDHKTPFEKVREEDNSFARHLNVCADCMLETKLLLGFASTEANETLDIAIPNRPGKATLASKLQKRIERIILFGGFSLAEAAPVRGSTFALNSLEINLSDELSIELDPTLHSQNSELRDLFITLKSQKVSQLEGSSIIALDHSGEVKESAIESAVGQYGEAHIAGLIAGELYDLIISIPNKTFKIESVSVP